MLTQTQCHVQQGPPTTSRTASLASGVALRRAQGGWQASAFTGASPCPPGPTWSRLQQPQPQTERSSGQKHCAINWEVQKSPCPPNGAGNPGFQTGAGQHQTSEATENNVDRLGEKPGVRDGAGPSHSCEFRVGPTGGVRTLVWPPPWSPRGGSGSVN